MEIFVPLALQPAEASGRRPRLVQSRARRATEIENEFTLNFPPPPLLLPHDEKFPRGRAAGARWTDPHMSPVRGPHNGGSSNSAGPRRPVPRSDPPHHMALPRTWQEVARSPPAIKVSAPMAAPREPEWRQDQSAARIARRTSTWDPVAAPRQLGRL